MCWHTSWDVDCDHCVTAERDYLLFLSRHFIILESDKYPGESRPPHLIMSSQCLYFRTPDYYQEYESSCSRASSSLSSDSGSDLYCAARPDKTYYRVQVSYGAKLKSLFSVKTTEYFNVPFLAQKRFGAVVFYISKKYYSSFL